MRNPIKYIKNLLKFTGHHKIDDLHQLVDKYCQNQIIDADAAHFISRILDVSNTQVRDIQTPKSRMVFFTLSCAVNDVIDIIRQTKHSRFIILDDDEMKPIGILLTKDLLTSLLAVKHNFAMKEKHYLHEFKELMHTCHVTPDSKRIDHLLRELRQEHAHMAAVINEYGAVSGLVTIEDIIEEIIGEIEDEKDQTEEQAIITIDENSFLIDATTEISLLNESIESSFDDNYFDTIGGLVGAHFDHIPQPDELVIIDGFRIKIIASQKRRIEKIEITRPQPFTASHQL